MTGHDVADLLTVAEALRLLKVSRGTLHRWRKEGRLRAYHAGPKAVRFRRSDLEAMLTPVREEVTAVKEAQPAPMHVSAATIAPLTDERQKQALAALKASQELLARQRAKRGGALYEESWPLIRAGREERSEQLR